MYEAHFGFHRQPFQSADACRAFFVSESIHEILPQLLHALRSDLGIAVLTGVPGSGKTSLLRHIQQQFAKEGRVIVCSGANLGTSADLIAALLQASRMTGGTETTTKPVANERAMQGSRSSALDNMKRTAELWGPVLLLIDDVQLVPLPVLNELRACTEEEWNGRDLVRCLVSAPISFEEQLARQEYADFARRIRCHTFLQPLKSSESFLFLKDQIELAGGRISNVFTTPALESITAAAGGNPRCLGLLADETLVVAAMVGEKIASEKSVRTALSRLQHLQYHWNTSPHIDVAETAESDSKPTDIETESTETEKMTSSNSSVISSSTTPAVTRFNAPIQATIAPGVIEFGGPATSTTRTTVKTSSPVTALPAPIQQFPLFEDRSDYIDVSGSVELPGHMLPGELTNHSQDLRSTAKAPSTSFDNRTLTDINQSLPRNSTFEFGSLNFNTEVVHTPIVPAAGNTIPEFEVGQRFVSESRQESISIDDVEDRDILELLNLGDNEVNFASTTNRFMKTPPTSELAEFLAPNIVWFDGNADISKTQAPIETNSAKLTLDDDSTSLAIAEEVTPNVTANVTPTSAGSRKRGSEPESDDVVTSGRFFNVANAKLSNRLPVFDRYTWLALGREVPAGRSSVVSMSVTRQLIQADYFNLPSRRPTTVSSLSPNSQPTTAIDQIRISTTTDAALIDEIVRNSLNVESGVYLATGTKDSITAKISTTLKSVKSISVATSHDAKDSFDSNTAVETSFDKTHTVDSLAVSDSDTTEDSDDANPQSISGLRIWRDGMLVFSNGKPADDFNAPDSSVLSHESNTDDHQAIEALNEVSSTKSASSDESFLNHNVLQLDAGGFFTLPQPKPHHADELNSLKLSKDEDVYPFVEALNNMRADVQSFQDTGSVPAEDSAPVSRFPQSTDSANQSDNVVSRAKRRLDDRTDSADTKTIALQMSPEVRDQQKTQPKIESVLTTDGTLNTESAPKFGSLFTRLRETRKLTAYQAQTDVK